MNVARVLIAALGLGLGALIVWASLQGGSLFEEGARILALPWGKVTLGDLYLGFVLFSAVIFVFERNKLAAAAWILALFILGNAASAFWLAWRLPDLAKRLTKS